jgi:hypothetical protein
MLCFSIGDGRLVPGLHFRILPPPQAMANAANLVASSYVLANSCSWFSSVPQTMSLIHTLAGLTVHAPFSWVCSI